MPITTNQPLRLQSHLDSLMLNSQVGLINEVCYPKTWVQTFTTLAHLELNSPSFGWLKGIIFNLPEIQRAGANPAEVFEKINAHTRLAYQALALDSSPSPEINQDISGVIYISEIFLAEELQGQGLGTQILQELPAHLQRLLKIPISHLFLFPLPLQLGPQGLQAKPSSRAHQQLSNFYQKNDFVKTNFLDYGLPLYIKKLR